MKRLEWVDENGITWGLYVREVAGKGAIIWPAEFQHLLAAVKTLSPDERQLLQGVLEASEFSDG